MKLKWRIATVAMYLCVFVFFLYVVMVGGEKLATLESERDALRERVEELETSISKADSAWADSLRVTFWWRTAQSRKAWSGDFDVDGEVYRVTHHWGDSSKIDTFPKPKGADNEVD